jgi:hypothetical protein
MVASSLHQVPASHIHVAGEHCPWCDQPIPHEKFEEITSRISTRERERFADMTRELKEQHARDKAQAEQKAKADLEAAQKARVTEIEQIKVSASQKEAAARQEERAAVEARMQAQIAEMQKTAAANQTTWQEKLQTSEREKRRAEESGAEFKTQLEELRTEKATEIEKLNAQAAANEVAARADERSKTLATARAELADARQARMTAETELHGLKLAQEAMLNERLHEQREALEKDKLSALNAKDAKHFEDTQKWTGKVAELQRALEKKTADERGEGAEIDLLNELKLAFPTDRIEQITKREGGADVRHVVMYNGKECDLILYDSKDRNRWLDEYTDKLARDQRAAKAEYAILSTRSFPARAKGKQLYIDGSVILANPARVVAPVQIIRRHIVHVHKLRLSGAERAKKTAALYEFITSKRCAQLFDAIDAHAQDLLAMQEKEIKTHQNNWKHQGQLLRSIQKVRADLEFEIEQIIGTADENR